MSSLRNAIAAKRASEMRLFLFWCVMAVVRGYCGDIDNLLIKIRGFDYGSIDNYGG